MLGVVLGSGEIGSCKRQHPARCGLVRSPQGCGLWIELPKGSYRLRKENVLLLNSWQPSAVGELGTLSYSVEGASYPRLPICPRIPVLCGLDVHSALSGLGLLPCGRLKEAGSLSAGCPGPLGLLGHPLHTLEEAEAGAQGQGLHLDNTPTQGTKAHCLSPRWRGSGWEAASLLSPNPLVVGGLRSNSQNPAPAWAPCQAAFWAGTFAKLSQPLPCSWPQFPPSGNRPGEHQGGRVELAVGLGAGVSAQTSHPLGSGGDMRTGFGAQQT